MKTFDELCGDIRRCLDKLEIPYGGVGPTPGQPTLIVAVDAPLTKMSPPWIDYVIGVWQMSELRERSSAEVLDLVRQRVGDWRKRFTVVRGCNDTPSGNA